MTALKESSSYQLRYIRNRLIVLFDLMVEREPELVRDILDQILDLTRDMWMAERIRRGWVKTLIRTGSQIVRPVSRRIALRYIHANLSEAIVESILTEIERIILEQQIEAVVRGKAQVSSSKGTAGLSAPSEPAVSAIPTLPTEPAIVQNVQEEQKHKPSMPPLVWAGVGFCLGVFATYVVIAPGRVSPKTALPAAASVASECLIVGLPRQSV